MPPDPKPERRPKATPRGLARSRMRQAPRSTPRVGVGSRVNPPAIFRERVWYRTGGRCVVTGLTSSVHARGEFDPAHLIPAQMIRSEVLEDYVYEPGLGLWLARVPHFEEDDGKRHLTRELLESVRPRGESGTAWSALVILARSMDAALTGSPREPFTAYVLERYR